MGLEELWLPPEAGELGNILSVGVTGNSVRLRRP